MAAVTARRFRTRGDGQVGFATGRVQFFGDRAARLPGPDNQHSAIRQLLGGGRGSCVWSWKTFCGRFPATAGSLGA